MPKNFKNEETKQRYYTGIMKGGYAKKHYTEKGLLAIQENGRRSARKRMENKAIRIAEEKEKYQA